MEKAIEWLHKTWWGLIVALVIICIFFYSLIWGVIEPLSIPDTFEKIPRWLFHITLSLLLGSISTLILDLYIRHKFWLHKKITSEELKRVQKEIKPLSDEIGLLYGKKMDTTDIQNIMSKSVSVISQVHFEQEEFPLLDESKVNWEFQLDEKTSCAKCKSDNIEVTKSGQCKKCKMPFPNWYQ